MYQHTNSKWRIFGGMLILVKTLNCHNSRASMNETFIKFHGYHIVTVSTTGKSLENI